MDTFEFIIDGPPVSQQTRRRRRLVEWRQAVLTAARSFWPAGALPFGGLVSVTVFYFYVDAPVDIDNIVKPIHDALIGLVYADDLQVSDSINRRRALHGEFFVGEITPILAMGLDRRTEFLYVRVSDAPDRGGLYFA
ncbi:MAG TPA: RusA family crossover junction endodeoxyribonuclease [Longimicrobiaceae bacterium]|nr:RusA family crossover junction endodeoxyribonuclease [Longimicrobiaceae bacterium]